MTRPADPTRVKAKFPSKLQVLFRPARYKVLYGGRGGAKSWGIARALLILGVGRQLRIVCAREIQNSIAQSVHQLLKDQIAELGFGGFYRVTDTEISGANGTQFLFVGLKHNIQSVKSLEGCDICWVEEAQTVSKGSWDILTPTIRKQGSEIWISFNPLLESDDTYQRWVVRAPSNAVVVRVSYLDNPWCPQTLITEAETLKESNPAEYDHIWGGICKSVLDGAIYAEQLRDADKAGRITRVPYDPSRPVHTYWDLGVADSTAIWFAQSFPFEHRIIDFLEGSGKGLQFYLKELQGKPYVYGNHHLPHDGRSRELGTGKSIEELVRAAGLSVRIVPGLGIADGIEAARTIFPLCWFDAERCADGIHSLRHYVYGEIERLGVKTKEPLHNWASHAADAWRYFAVAAKAPAASERRKPAPRKSVGSWMA